MTCSWNLGFRYVWWTTRVTMAVWPACSCPHVHPYACNVTGRVQYIPCLGVSHAFNCCDHCQSPADDADTSSMLDLQAPLVDHIQARFAVSLISPIHVVHLSHSCVQSHLMATGLQYQHHILLQVTGCPLHLHMGSPSPLKEQLLLVDLR